MLSGTDRAIQIKMLEFSGRKTVDQKEFPLVTTAGNVLSEKYSDLFDLSFSACIRLVPKLLIFGHFASIVVVGIASTRLANTLLFCFRLLPILPRFESLSECFQLNCIQRFSFVVDQVPTSFDASVAWCDYGTKGQ